MAVSQSLTLTQVSQSIEENTSQVRILWKSTQTDASYNDYKRTAKYYVSINGGAEVTYSVSYTLPKGKTKTVLDKTITVPHNADGTGTVSVRTWMDTDISAGVVKKNASLTLTTIPRATTPEFYEDAVYMGKTATIYLHRASESFKHDLSYSYAGSEFIPLGTNLDTVFYWQVPDLATSVPKSNTLRVTIRCTTKSGGTVVGVKDAVLLTKVPAGTAYSPKITNVIISEATEGMGAHFGVFVKDKTTLAVSIEAEGAKGSTIKSYSTSLEGKNYTSAGFVSDVLTVAGELTLVTTVIDTRDRLTQLETTIPVVDYFLPRTMEFLAYRVDENGVAKDDGKYLSVAFAYEVAPVDGQNTADMTIDFKQSTAPDWSDPILEGHSLQGSGVVQFEQQFTPDYQFDIRMTVVDWFGAEASYTATLPTDNVILDIKAEGDGLAFGKTSEFPGFEVDMPAMGESFKMVGIRDYEIGESYGRILYNNGLLLQWGSVSVTPTAINTVTTLTVAFPTPYVTRPHIIGTILVSSPEVVSWSMGVGTSEAAAVSSLVIYMHRSTLHATPFRWMALGLADMTNLPEVTAE